MYIHERDPNIRRMRDGAIGEHARTDATKIGDPMTYAGDLANRLTGYGMVRARHRAHGAAVASEGARALCYAEYTFARMKGHKAGAVPDYGEGGHEWPGRDGRRMNGPAGGETAGARNGKREHHAVAYALDLFKRLRGLPVLHRDPAHRPAADATAGVRPAAEALRRVMGRGARLLRKGVLERYLRRRRRRLAIAELQALDDRLLADIGLRRNDIERAVDGLLARRGAAPATPVRRRSPVTSDEDHWRLAA